MKLKMKRGLKVYGCIIRRRGDIGKEHKVQIGVEVLSCKRRWRAGNQSAAEAEVEFSNL